jgi:hypothetical protein
MRRTASERKSDRELIITRTFDGPARLVFEAWTSLSCSRCGVPKSSGATLLCCEQDVRVGDSYRLEFAHPPRPRCPWRSSAGTSKWCRMPHGHRGNGRGQVPQALKCVLGGSSEVNELWNAVDLAKAWRAGVRRLSG